MIDRHRTPITPAPEVKPSPASRLFVANLILIGTFGVALSGWILFYTDYFEVFGGLLSLTGLFSWLAFISKALPEDRLKALQSALDNGVFNRRRTSIAILCCFLLGAVVASFVGAVQVEAMQEAGDRALWVHPIRSGPGEPARLAAGGSVRSLIWTSWWSPSKVRVKVSGYPDLFIAVRPWERVRLYTLSSFLRPVVLLQPSVELINAARNYPMSLVVRSGGQERQLKFDGHALWIGCDDDVQIPAAMQDLFRSQLSAPEHIPLLLFWLYPYALPGDRWELQPGNQVEAKLLRPDGAAYSSTQFVVLPIQRRQDFPQVEVLDVPH